jgi:periplasmic divalent cation tolerance protein
MKGSPGKLLIVLVTVGKEEQAEKIGRHLLKQRLVACVSVIPRVRSLYRWKGKLVDERETLMILKTTQYRFAALEKAIKVLHAYEVPEILGISVLRGNPQYLAWVTSEVDK